MFVNFSFLKNFHSKRLRFKCCGPYRLSHQRNHSVTLEFPVLYPKYAAPAAAAAACVKNYKYLQLYLKKSRVQNLEILRRSLRNNSTSSSEKNGPDDKPPFYKMFAIFLGISFLAYIFGFGVQRINRIKKISWEEFKYEILAKGECKSLKVYIPEKTVLVEVHEGAIIKNEKAVDRFFFLEIPDIRKFEEKLREAEMELRILPTDRVLITYHSISETPTAIILCVLLIIGLIWYLGNKSMKSFKQDLPFFKLMYTLVDPLAGEGKGVKFSDVAGLKEAKREIMDFVDYLKRPEIYRNLGAKVPKGALLLGPPGCGKTLLAKAVATEASVPFLSMNGSEFIEIVGGLGAARVRNLFKDAKKRSPCIIYIDEIDAIGRKRETLGYGGGEAEQTLNQLLVEMDGVVSNEGVVLLASTNRADVLDKALLRPGRFDRQILIDLPTYQERQEIFERHLKEIHLEHKPETYSKRMAHLTPGFSGADIANVCNEAALHAARLQKQIVQADDLEYAVERVVGGTEKRSSARTPEEKKMFAYYEAGRALVGWLSKYGEALLKITIVARTDTPAGWTHFSPNEKLLYSADDLRGKMCMGLAGRVALTLLFNRTTTAGEKDLKKVTKLAYAQVRRFGMNENIGLMSFDVNADDKTLKKPYSKALGNMFDHEARKLVAEVYREAEKILTENKDKLIKLAEELLVKETLNYEDVVQLIGPPVFEGKKLVEPLEFAQSLDQAVGGEPDTPEETKNV